MSNEPSVNVRSRAQQLAVTAAEHDERGNTGRADAAQARAEAAFEEAGLDPDWHDEDALVAAKPPERPVIYDYGLPEDRVELTECPLLNAPVLGVVADESDVVEVER